MESLPYVRRVGLIGDVHAEADLLAQIIRFLRSQQVDALLCLGDVTDGFGDIDRCFALLEEEQVYTVLGNHDRWCLQGELRNLPECHHFQNLSPQSQRFLQQLPVTRELQTPRGKALMCHGIGNNDMGKILPGHEPLSSSARLDLQRMNQGKCYRYLLNGHSHYRMVRQVEGITVINAGTIKQQHQPGFVLMDFETGCGQAFDVRVDGVRVDGGGWEQAIARIVPAEPLNLPQPILAAS